MLLFFYKEWMISCMEETVTLRLVSLSFLPEETQYKAKGGTHTFWHLKLLFIGASIAEPG